MAQEIKELKEFAEKLLGEALSDGRSMPGGGSDRQYYRFICAPDEAGISRSVIGVIGRNEKENRAFLGFTAHFAAQGLPVPRILGADQARGLYVMEDLGDSTLARHLVQWRAVPAGRVMAMAALSRVIGWLPRFQVHGGAGLDYGLCFEGEELDAFVFETDLERFLRVFVSRHAPRTKPDERVLGELDLLVTRLETVPREHFCYRDFQSRNIMWREGPVFLDYQAGRRGALQYDLASFLYSPDTGLDEKERAILMDTYLKGLKDCGVTIDKVSFLADFHPFLLVRRLQALGAYAHLADSRGEPAYLKKIPPALADLQNLMRQGKLQMGLPALEKWLAELLKSAKV